MPASAQINQWLDQLREDVIDAGREICDPHHHLWDHDLNAYLLPELLADIGQGHNVVSTVFVECGSMYSASVDKAMAPVGETEFVNGIAAMSASGQYGLAKLCAGIVSYADLTLGDDVGPVLDAHMVASPRFRGIRHAAGWDASEAIRNSHTKPTENLFLEEKFQRGFAQLEKRGLSFDAWLYHPQITDLTVLAKAFPKVTIVFDHFGGPLGIGPYSGKGEEIFNQWQKDVAQLATCPNVVAKLGGIVMPINGFGLHKRDMPPSSDEIVATTGRYHDYAIKVFGPERCMFESNFPVDKQSCSYHVLWNAFKKIAQKYTQADQQWLFHDAASQAYRLI